MIEIIVELDQEGIRLDQFCGQYLSQSRSKIAGMIKEGKVEVNRAVSKPSYIVKVDDEVTIRDYEPKPVEIKPVAMDLDIVYEDDQLMVINKPKGLVVHPGAGVHHQTLVAGLVHYTNQLSSLNDITRPGIVHRLDKDTSGLMVVAKNDVAHAFLANQLKDHTLKRIYQVIVDGVFPHLKVKVDAPIGRDEKIRVKMAVTEKASKEAVSHFTKLESFKNHSLLQCQLETGRTHQIRVHCEYMGYPVTNDPLYNTKPVQNGLGQYLCATQIEFIHPTTLEKVSFEIQPDKEFLAMLDHLKGEMNE